MVRRLAKLLSTVVVGSVLVISPVWGQDGDSKSKKGETESTEVIVTKITEKGMAHVKESSGKEWEVVKGTGWKIGDKLICEEHTEAGKPKLTECHKG